jgi:murein tripeptide amidase MpaA
MKQTIIFSFLILIISCSPKTAEKAELQTAPQVTQDEMVFLTPFETQQNYSATYMEAILFYKQLEKAYPNYLSIKEVGFSDIGRPMHNIILSENGANTAEKTRQQNKQVLFINNAIHAGEPCGIDASMLLVRDILTSTYLKRQLQKLTIVIIPVYNIGGSLNRNSTTRANQNGPIEYGFRGNAQNLDLNRDFIKCDSKNALTFNQNFTNWMPDVFIDNHTSNGADYQYTMTLIPTQHNKLAAPLAKVLNEEMLPFLFKNMKARKWEMTPYVYARTTPDEGIAGFLDLPRYSSGYASLFNCISFMPETHMLKPYKDRVRSTLIFMNATIDFMVRNEVKLKAAKAAAIAETKTKSTFDINWEIDRTKVDSIIFKGYTAKYKPSEISGLERLYYDQNEPYEKVIPHYNYYKTTQQIEKPKAYFVPQSAWKIIERLQNNKVEMQQLQSDTILEVEVYYIEDYETKKQAYEGHYLHSKVKVRTEMQKVKVKKGDYLIFTNQDKNRYIIETLEPQAPDSYFAWNFFDAVLQRKEYFSPYVFEDLAVQILTENPDIKAALATKKAEDEKFRNSAYDQLFFIYERSQLAEKTYMRYPVFRLK